MTTATSRPDSDLDRCIRLVTFIGSRLLENGAESALIRDLMLRTSRIMGADDTEISLSSNSMVLTIFRAGKWMTITSRCPERSVNMGVVTHLHKAVIMREKNEISTDAMEKLITSVEARKYSQLAMAAATGISCAFFSKLAGGDMKVFCTTLAAAFLGRLVFLFMGKDRFNPLVSSFASAFVCTCVCAAAMLFHFGNTPETAVYSSILMLVPGFPLINSFSDMLKGFKNMGVARLVSASLLTLSVALGMLCAMGLMGV